MFVEWQRVWLLGDPVVIEGLNRFLEMLLCREHSLFLGVHVCTLVKATL